MISVIIPVYNVDNYLKRCIESVINQTYYDLEILLIDDGSSDNSLDICQKYQTLDKRIKVIHHENCGVSVTRNEGLSMMRGEFLFFLDADDWIEPTCLQRMINEMKYGVDMVCCDFKVVEENNCDYDEFIHFKHQGLKNRNECIDDYYNSLLYMRVIWGKLYRSSLWENQRFENICYSEDTKAILQVIQHVQNVYFINEPMYYYLQRVTGASHEKSINYYQDILKTLEYAFQLAKKSYPIYQIIAAQDYINIAYALVKIHIIYHDDKNAYTLLNKMKTINKSIPFNQATKAQKLLYLPCNILQYLLQIRLRNVGKNYE